jgi:hypothetical protein
MTEVRQGSTGVAWEGSSGGVSWHVELDRSILLPGRLVTGRLAIRADREIEARGVVVGLIAEEHWRHRVTTRGANGTTTTRVVTSREELLREPVLVHGPLRIPQGETWTATFEQPVPGMGPATLFADDAGLEWAFEAKLDVKVEAIVSQGEAETITAWSKAIAPGGSYEGSVGIDVNGAIDARPLPTIELPHGRAQATFDVILARAWALDTHLARDVTVATTSEL